MPGSTETAPAPTRRAHSGAIALGAAVAVTLLAHELGAPGGILAYLAATVYALFGLYLWRASKIHFLLLFPFYFELLTAVLSNVYLEHGAYISEQYRYSYTTGSTVRLVAYAGIFLGSMFAVMTRLAPSDQLRAAAAALQRSQRMSPASIAIIGIASAWLIVLLGSGLLYGFPLFLRQDRFSYWASHPIPYLWRILIQGMQLSFLLGVVYGALRPTAMRRAVLWVFLLMLATNVLFGDKFSSSALALMHFGAAALIMRYLVYGIPVQLSKLLPRLSLVVVAFLLLVSWSYRAISQIASQDVLNYILSRALALQGHTWWGIDVLVREGSTNSASWEHLLRAHSPETPGGLYLLMYAIAPPDAVTYYMTNGITFTMGGIAIVLYTLGYLRAVPFLLLAGAATGAVLAYQGHKTARMELFRAWIALKLVWIALLAFGMGNVYLIVGVSTSLYLLIVFADLLQKGIALRRPAAST